jgi:hypothetical protein
MIAARCTPLRIYNTIEKKRHKYAINSSKPIIKNKEIEKLKLIASWNLRATQSALKNCEEMVQILEDLSN